MRSYADHPATTVTAIVVTNTETGKTAKGVDTATVYFNPIPEDVMQKLIDDGDIFSCAGGFQIEYINNPPPNNTVGAIHESPLNKEIPPPPFDKGGEYIRCVEGDVDSVKGLPMKLLKTLISNVNGLTV